MSFETRVQAMIEREETRCPLATHFALSGPCSGRIDRCHIGFLKQTLKREGLSDEEIWDSRIILLGCRTHHDHFDGPWCRVERHQLPYSVIEFAYEHEDKRLPARLDRDFGPACPCHRHECPGCDEGADLYAERLELQAEDSQRDSESRVLSARDDGILR